VRGPALWPSCRLKKGAVMNVPHDELLVLDWVFCGQGAHADLALMENLMRWRDLRERVWRGIMSAQLDKGPALMDFTETETEELLALVPTTFRWGTGEDVGFSLKQRLAESLWGQAEQDAAEKRKQMRALFQEEQNANSAPSDKPNQDNPGYNPEDLSEG